MGTNLVKRLDASAARGGRGGRERLAKLLAGLWMVVQHAGRFWDGLSEHDKQTLRGFFAQTKGDPRQIARRPAKERAEIVRIFREGLTNLPRR